MGEFIVNFLQKLHAQYILGNRYHIKYLSNTENIQRKKITGRIIFLSF